MKIPQPYVNDNVDSFAHISVQKRWPAIVDGIISDLAKAVADVNDEAKKAESSDLKEAFAKIKAEVEAGAPLKPFTEPLKEQDKVYNEELAKLPSHQTKWATAPWLFSECYLYREVQRAVEATKYWKDYDVFALVKRDTFEKSAEAVSALAKRYVAVTEQIASAKDQNLSSEVLTVLLKEVLDTSLWGNATDLSLLVTVSMEELKKLQVAASDRDKEAVLKNDFEQIEKALIGSPGGRVDIVLDNSGFELYTDLILALFLLDTGISEQVVFHPKNQPWFVSDVTPRDWLEVIDLLRDAKRFPKDRDAIDTVVKRILERTDSGQLLLRTNDFWTTPLPFWELREGGRGGGDAAWHDLRGSQLVIFKGDLNYRKLIYDLAWDRATPFREAIQTTDVHLASLRTIKADTVAGLAPGTEERVVAKWQKENPDKPKEAWAWSGSYAVVSYHIPASSA